MRCSRGHPRQQCHSDIILPARDEVFIVHESFAWAQPHRIEHKAEAMRQSRQQEMQAGETIFRDQHASPVQVSYRQCANDTEETGGDIFRRGQRSGRRIDQWRATRFPVTGWERTVG